MKDGKTKREHYIAAGVPVEDWGLPEFPDLLFDLWHWFLELHSDRCGGMGGPITHLIIDAFCRVRGIRLQGWEIDGIRMLDNIALEGAKE